MKKAKLLLSLLLACFVTPGFAITQAGLDDRDIAFQIWGNPQNFLQNPHPNANYSLDTLGLLYG